ncbi:MAG TPA: hypothetical protein VH105_15305 [Burkholderiales bacterium]|jgi:hypothetical protein|nr:hypothetical protein [Burkholderiales bacterium]
MQNTERLSRRAALNDSSSIDRDLREHRALAGQWEHDASARRLIALDAAIRRAAWAVAGFFGRR